MSVDKLAVIVITDGLRRDSIEALSTPALEALRRESVWLRRHHSAAPSVTRCLFSHDRNGLQSASPRTGGQQALSP